MDSTNDSIIIIIMSLTTVVLLSSEKLLRVSVHPKNKFKIKQSIIVIMITNCTRYLYLSLLPSF